jgi:copper chaperone CopZ
MTAVDVVFRFGATPGEREIRAIDAVREVYGIRRITFNPKERTVRVEFDASRLTDDVVAGLLRRAGLDLREKLALA